MGSQPDNHQFTVEVKGLHEGEKNDQREKLLTQLSKIPQDAHRLCITEDTPSDIEWDLLSKHFSNVRDLQLHTGFNEQLTDGGIPAHWPLERLFISDACGEVFRSPFVLEGKIKSLVLLGTCGLRFEGPTSEELYRAHREAISRGDKKPEHMTVNEGTPEARDIELVWLPNLVADEMNRRYAGTRAAQLPTRQGSQSPPCLPKEVSSNMTKLEIIENDAMDTFNRMTMALPHVVGKLTTLNIRSTHGLDLNLTGEETFTSILPQLSELRTLVLSVGEVFENEVTLPNLHTLMPPGITTLRFRGPASLVRSDKWDNWVASFASPQFLPNLKRLSFVLDLYYGPLDQTTSKKKLDRAPDDVLDNAQDACEQLYRVVAERGVVVEPFQDKWCDHWSLLQPVDERWTRRG